MKNYLLVRNGAGAAFLPLPLNGTVREVHTAEEAVAAVESGELSESRVDESVRRILLCKARIGLLN